MAEDNLFGEWKEGIPELYGEWGRKEEKKGYYEADEESGGINEEEIPRKLEELLGEAINRVWSHISINVRKKFPKECVFFERDIQKELARVMEAYVENPEGSLEIFDDLFAGWCVYIAGKVFGNRYETGEREFNSRFGQEILNAYDDLYHFIENTLVPVSKQTKSIWDTTDYPSPQQLEEEERRQQGLDNLNWEDLETD